MILSCSKHQAENTENNLARVENQYLSLNDAIEEIPEYLIQQDSIYALHQYRDNWVKKQLLLNEVDRLGLAEKREVQKKIKKAHEEVLIQALNNYVTALNQDNEEISDEEARSFYQANKDQFALDEKFVKFRHLRADNSSDARSAKQELLQGVSWEEVASKYANNPEAVLRESNQFWPISMAAKEFRIMNRYLDVIGLNEISPIQRIDGVYHFVQLLDRRAKGEQPDLTWLTDRIKDWITRNKNQRNFSSYVKNLYLEAKSNNEIDIINVTPSQSNRKNTLSDTLEPNSTDD